MKNYIRRKLISLAPSLASLLWLPGILFINSCGGEPTDLTYNNNPIISEIIVFCGNPGVGKSSLCNSIFLKNVFKSGASNGGGITQHKQEYIYDHKQYIDTPGLSDVQMRQQAAEEIGKALKANNNYKIVFVATLEAGRIREADLVTINTVCDAIETHFEYGIIFNKVTKPVIKLIGDNGERLGSYLGTLHKQPSSTLVIKKDADMEDESDIYLDSSSEERTKLINFIAELQANVILVKHVQPIDVRAYEEKVRKMETDMQELKKVLEKEKERAQEEKIVQQKLLEQQRQEMDGQRKEIEIRRIEQQKLDSQLAQIRITKETETQELKKVLEKEKERAQEERIAQRKLLEQQRQEIDGQRKEIEIRRVEQQKLGSQLEQIRITKETDLQKLTRALEEEKERARNERIAQQKLLAQQGQEISVQRQEIEIRRIEQQKLDRQLEQIRIAEEQRIKQKQSIEEERIKQRELIEKPDSDGNLLIHRLIGDDKTSFETFCETVKLTPKDKINARNNRGFSPLYVLLFSELKDQDKLQRLQIFLENGGSDWGNGEYLTPYGVPLLMFAAYRESAAMVRALLLSGKFEVNLAQHRNKVRFFGVKGRRWNALYLATLRDDGQIVRMLLEAGADKNMNDSYYFKNQQGRWEDFTPIQLAYHYDRYAASRVLNNYNS